MLQKYLTIFIIENILGCNNSINVAETKFKIIDFLGLKNNNDLQL